MVVLFFVDYIFLRCFKLGDEDGRKKETALKLVLDFESPSKKRKLILGFVVWWSIVMQATYQKKLSIIPESLRVLTC